MTEQNGRIGGGDGVSEIPRGFAEVVAGGVPVVASGLGPQMPGLDKLRVDSGVDGEGLVEKRQVVIQVTKPKADWFIQVNPALDQSVRLRLHEGEERTYYLVDPQMNYGLRRFGADYDVHTAVTRDGEAFLFPVRHRHPGSKANTWTDSMHAAVELAKNAWVRIESDPIKKAYCVTVAMGDLGNPVWPTDDLQTRIHRAFAGRYINSVDHPIVRKLQGLE